MLKIDNAYRMRAMALDLGRLEAMLACFLDDALRGDLVAGHLCLKLAERRAAMLGTGAPVRIDVVQFTQNTRNPEGLAAVTIKSGTGVRPIDRVSNV